MSIKNFERIQEIERALKDGEVLSKEALAEKYEISEKQIQRDIAHLKEKYPKESGAELIYSRSKGGYFMKITNPGDFTNSEILAVCKIVLESRAFNEPDMRSVLDKMLKSCTAKGNYKKIMEAIANETEHYRGPYHKKSFIGLLWDISNAIRGQKFVDIKCEGSDEFERIKPAGLMFSEHYFYLLAYDTEEPKKYRVDSIEKFDMLNEGFYVPYAERFQEGEYRKHIHNMVGGRSRIIKFWFKSENAEEVMDMFPEARIIEEKDGRWLIRTEVFGDGADFWFKGFGDRIEIVEDKKTEDSNMTDFYNDGGSSEITLKIEMFKKDDLRDPVLDGKAITWELTGSNGGTYENACKTVFDHININVSPKQLGEAKDMEEVIELLKNGVTVRYGKVENVHIFDEKDSTVVSYPEMFKESMEYISELRKLGDFDLIDFICIESESGDTMIYRQDTLRAESSYTQTFKFEKNTGNYKARVLGNESKKGNGVGGGLYFDDTDKCSYVTWDKWNDTVKYSDSYSNVFVCRIEIITDKVREIVDENGITHTLIDEFEWEREGWNGNWGEEGAYTEFDHIIVQISPKQLGQAKRIEEMKELLRENVFIGYGIWCDYYKSGRGLHCFNENDPDVKELLDREYNLYGENSYHQNIFRKDIEFINALDELESIDDIKCIRISGYADEVIVKNDMVDQTTDYKEIYEYYPETGEYKGIKCGGEKYKWNGVGGGLYFDDLDECKIEETDSVYGDYKETQSMQEHYLSWTEQWLDSFASSLDKKDDDTEKLDISEDQQKTALTKIEQIKTLIGEIKEICGFLEDEESQD